MLNIAPEWTAAQAHNASDEVRRLLGTNRVIPFFTRSGIEAQSTVYADGKKRFCLETRYCKRCGGKGGADAWRATGWTCYECAGTGGKHEAVVTVYTAEQLAKLNARQDAKLAAKAAADRAKEEAALAAFDAAYPEIVAKLAQIPAPSAFVADVVAKGRKHGILSDRQVEALHKALDREIARKDQNAASQYVGTIGERIEFTATITFVTGFEGSFGYVHVTGLRDDAGNLYIQKGKFLGSKGETLRVKATVKAHELRDDVAQTIITRPSII